MAKSAFLVEAKARGFVFQCTDEAALDAALLAGPVAAYAGFDLTADSLHVGHMIPIMLLRLFQKHGHRPVAVVGGGTSRIGDPSFREEARVLLTDEQIAANLAGIRANITRFLHFDAAPGDAILVNNADWLDQLGFIAFLREVGPHFSISRMLAFDSVRTRLERDIVSGIDLIRRTEQKTVFGLTTPLITTASGAKMGKSAAGAVWLTAAKLSPYNYWQFWRNTEDADVGKFLRLFTDLSLDEIARLDALTGAEINDAKIILATEATALAHGRDAAKEAAETARKTFAEGAAAEGLPSVTLTAAELAAGIPAFALFVRAGLAASNGEARRLIRGGGARLDDVAITDEAMLVTAPAKLSAGKKQHVLVRVS